ncbi:MAG: DNA methyltransferase [Promethearchaeota archaeon]
MNEWKDILNPVTINPEQRKKILKGKSDAYIGKAKLLSIFGKIPNTIWEVKNTKKIDITERSQHKIAEQHRNATLKAFDKSTRNQNIRWKGAISMFPRNILEELLEFYTEKGDVFFDPFAGHNSRMEAAFKKGRHYIGWDCSHEFMEFNRKLMGNLLKDNPKSTRIKLVEGDSRNIDEKDNSMDFIFTSPPYWCLEWYSDEPEQLGNLSYPNFMKDITKIYTQCFRVLKPGKFCIINVNDFRLNGKYYSYHVDTVNALKRAGFKQFDTIIMKYSNSMRQCFPNQILKEKLLPKVHEYLLVFLKPDPTKKGAFPWLKK